MTTTNHTESCLDKLYRVQEARPAAEDILLQQSWLGYAWYRLRLFSASKGIGIVLHFVELFLFFSKLQQNVFISLALLRLFISLLEAAWWGLLEGLRSAVRHDLVLFRLTKIQNRINCWYTWAVLATTTILLVGLTLATFGALCHFGQQGEFFWLYLFCLLFRLAGSILSRTVHAAVYGFSRVYRPLWSIVGPDLIWLFSLITLWPLCQLWAVIYATILSAVTSTVLTIYFCRPLYERLHITFPQARFFFLKYTRLGPQWSDLISALASVAMRVGSLLVMGYFTLNTADNIFNNEMGMVGFYMYLFFIMALPLLDVAISWSNLFYFDLKKYSAQPFSAIMPRFYRFMNFISWDLGLITWLLALLVGLIFLREGMLYLWFGSGLFLILRSRLGAVQMRAFCQNRYWVLITASVLLALGMWLLQQTDFYLFQRDILFGAILLTTILFLEVALRLWPAKMENRQEVPYGKWLDLLKLSINLQADKHQTVFIIDFKEHSRRQELTLQTLAEKMPAGGAITMLCPSRLLYFTAGTQTVLPWTGEELFNISGGEIIHTNKVTITANTISGDRLPWLTKNASFIKNINELNSLIKQHFPQTMVLDLSQPDKEVLNRLSAANRHVLLKNSYRYILFGEPVKMDKFTLLAYAPNGLLQTVFILPHNYRDSQLLSKYLRHLYK